MESATLSPVIGETMQVAVPTGIISGKFYPVRDVALVFGVSKMTIHRWLKSGILSAQRRRGARIYIAGDEILRQFSAPAAPAFEELVVKARQHKKGVKQ